VSGTFPRPAYPWKEGDPLFAAELNAAIAAASTGAPGKDGAPGAPGVAGPAGAPGAAGPPGPAGSGGVTSLATTGGISGGPITTTGTLAVNWNGPLVNAIDAATLSAAGGTLKVTAAGSGGAPTGAAGGDLSGSYPNPVLAATGVSAGSYGDAAHVPVVTVDGKGRVTTMGIVTLTAPAVSFASVTGTATFNQLPVSVQSVPITFGFSGKPASGAIANAPISMAITVPSALVGATIYCSTKTTSNAAFTVNRITGGTTITAIGTVTVTSASNVSATLAGTGATLAVGDVLQVVSPTQDATLSDIGITLLASRV
jgi:hypothetical protein